MQFQLPSNLRQQVAIYDPQLKPIILEQQRAAKGKTRKNTAPLGLPDNLFPESVLSKEAQLEIVKRINTQPASDRSIYATTDNHCYLVHHHEKVWVAAWHPLVDNLLADDVPYIYGLTVAFKAAPSTSTKVRNIRTSETIWDKNFIDETLMEEVKHGRTMFLQRSKTFTLADIRNGEDAPIWIAGLNSWGNNYDKWCSARQFSNSIGGRIPTWKDRNTFTRIADKDNSVSKYIFTYSRTEFNLPGDMTAGQVIKSTSDHPIFNTPYFMREAQKAADKCNAAYHDPENIESDTIKQPYSLWLQRAQMALLLIEVYGDDIPVDHIQKMFDLGMFIKPSHVPTSLKGWIQDNVPVTSFISWYQKELDRNNQEWQKNPEVYERSKRHSNTGLPSVYCSEINDTFTMMNNIWEHQNKDRSYGERQPLSLERPARWRMAEFHDFVSAKVWQYRNVNEDLPQDLFPDPIKVEHLNSVWTFFQPRDVHQLGMWGQAVRNCVGNASNYREGVKKRSHFIVLAMIDQRPRFTIQLKVRNGILEVDQIADIGNRRLDDNERASYELTFSMALKIRDNQLAPEEAKS